MSIFGKSKNKRPEATKPAETASVAEKTHLGGRHLSKEVLVRPHVSEKAQMIQGTNQYVFWVTNDANKSLVKEEIEKSYGVHVAAVNILIKKMKPKHFRNIEGRKRVMKKAIVTLEKGEKLTIA